MLVQWIVGGALGYLVSWVAALGFDVDPTQVASLQAALVSFGVYLVSDLVQRYQSKHNAKLQEALNLPPEWVDQWIGPETIRIAEAAMKRLQSPRR